MKQLSLAAIGLVQIAASVLQAQDVPLPKQDPATPPPGPSSAVPAVSPSPASSAPQLIPADVLPPTAPTSLPPVIPDLPTIPELDDSFKPPPKSGPELARGLNVQWRKLRNRVQNEPAVKAALTAAEAAPNDQQKRELLAKYYNLYFGRTIALADSPELKKYISDRKREQLRALQQPRVRPETASPGDRLRNRAPVEQPSNPAASTDLPTARPEATIPKSTAHSSSG